MRRRNAEAREGADDEMRRHTKLRFSILFYRIKKKIATRGPGVIRRHANTRHHRRPHFYVQTNLKDMFTLATTQLSARANVTASTSRISSSSSRTTMASPRVNTTTISKVLEGKVVSRANDKTAIVLIERQVPHPRYIKRINKSKRFAVHDEENESNVGDIVEIKMCVPKSKTKKFELKAITRKASA
jgi:small subunit ribosomal protein S17